MCHASTYAPPLMHKCSAVGSNPPSHQDKDKPSPAQIMLSKLKLKPTFCLRFGGECLHQSEHWTYEKWKQYVELKLAPETVAVYTQSNKYIWSNVEGVVESNSICSCMMEYLPDTAVMPFSIADSIRYPFYHGEVMRRTILWNVSVIS